MATAVYSLKRAWVSRDLLAWVPRRRERQRFARDPVCATEGMEGVGKVKLIANECVNCRRPVGYVATGALCIPTFCVLCAADKDTMEEWGHQIDPRERPIRNVLLDLRWKLNLKPV